MSIKYIEEYLTVIKKEISQRQDSKNDDIHSIYFGGGTPSILSKDQISTLIDHLQIQYNISEDVEITFEANPDDLSLNYLRELKSIGINRLSIGAQSFREQDLILMNRSHSREQTEEAIKNAKAVGFDNINLDLIYGIPDLSLEAWQDNLEKAFSLPITHLSAYHLTYEKDTIFDKWLRDGRIIPADEEDSIRQYLILEEQARINDFDHYEVSNFSKEGYKSRHNGIYWKGDEYFGFGTSAHSYDGKERRWNLDNVKRYMQAIKDDKNYFKKEILSDTEKYHDFLVTRLRTKEGINFAEVSDKFGDERVTFMKGQINKMHDWDTKEFECSDESFCITSIGWLRLDTITRLFMLD